MTPLKNLYDRLNRFFTETHGLYDTKPFIKATQLWPACTAILFGSFWYSGDRRPLGDLLWVWNLGRVLIVAMSIACLIFQNWIFLRELLGHSIVLYTYFACVAYWLAVPNHDHIFQGDLIRIIASSSAFYILTMLSVAILREKKKLEARTGK